MINCVLCLDFQTLKDQLHLYKIGQHLNGRHFISCSVKVRQLSDWVTVSPMTLVIEGYQKV